MKKYLIIGTILLLAASCHKQPPVSPQPQPQPAPSPAPNPTEGWNSYKSPDKYGFSITYPNDFGFTTDRSKVISQSYIPVCDEKMVACIYLPKDKYPNTNFDGAGVSINMLNTDTRSSMTDVDCYNFKLSSNPAQTQGADTTINGVVFKTATGGDAGAGHFDNIKVYRNFHNGYCYEIGTHIGSTNIGNYPEGTVTQFDENAVWQKLQDVINTFKFTVAASINTKIYSNAALGFTLEIPSNLEIKNRVAPDAGHTKIVDLSEPGNGRTISIFSYKPDALGSSICETLESEGGRETMPIDTKECQTVNGLQAVKTEVGVGHGDMFGLDQPSPYEGQSYSNVSWLFMKDPKVLSAISLGYHVEGEDYVKQQQWYDAIIKTFKFTK